MTPDELDRYANPILTQINRIAEEQGLIELAKAFKVRPSMGIGDDSSAFMSSLADAVARQSKSREVGDAVSNLTATTFKGAKSAPGSTIQNLMKLSYAGTLGQFDSAFLNLHDAAVAMVKNGAVPTLKAILNREGMDITEFGIGGNTKNIQESMELGDEIKALNKIYELQKAEQDLATERVKEYVVRPGDTITDVLERTGMSFAEFSALNENVSDLDSGDTIQVVQREVHEI